MAYSMIDMIARAHRMLGRAVLFPFGLDRNGINIERTVERKTGKPLHRWDREAFIAECRKEIEAIGNGLLELAVRVRSEERRVGKECRGRGQPAGSENTAQTNGR